MRIRLTFQFPTEQPPKDNAESPMFSGLPAVRPLWPTFIASTCAHALLVWLAFSYVQFLTTNSPDAVRTTAKMRVLDLSFMPAKREQIHFAPSESAPPASSHGGNSQPARRLARATPEPVSESSASQMPREFRLPPVTPHQQAAETLLQLDVPETVDVHQELHVPKLILLAETKQRLPPKPFVAPPERRTAAEPPRPVILEMRTPVLELQPGHAKTPEFLASAPPRLPPPSGAIAPVSGSHDPEPSKQAATITSESTAETANIISLPNRPIPAASSIVLPAVNQVSARDAGAFGGSGEGAPVSVPNGGATSTADVSAHGQNGPSGTATAQSLNSARAGNGSGHEGEGASNQGKTAGPGAGIGPGPVHGVTPGQGVGGTGGDHIGAGNPNDSREANGLTGSVAGNAGSASVTPRVDQPIRVIQPRDGHYEVAVVQSSGTVPGSAGLLRGRPVYSVYVSVGATKQWILQYCLQSSSRSEHAQVVQLGALTAVTAPYAYTIVRPALRFRNTVRYAFIHGIVNLAGKFEQLKEVGEENIDDITVLLESLGQWEFRPAVKDGVPVAVEILLCIPYQGS